MLPFHYGEPSPDPGNICISPSGLNERLALKQNGFSLDRVIGEGSYATVRLVHCLIPLVVFTILQYNMDVDHVNLSLSKLDESE